MKFFFNFIFISFFLFNINCSKFSENDIKNKIKKFLKNESKKNKTCFIIFDEKKSNKFFEKIKKELNLYMLKKNKYIDDCQLLNIENRSLNINGQLVEIIKENYSINIESIKIKKELNDRVLKVINDLFGQKFIFFQYTL